MTFTRRTKSYAMVLPIFLLCFVTSGNPCLAHEGPEPVAKWSFSKTQVDGRALKAVIGPDATVKGAIRFEQINERGVIHFDGTTTCIYVGDRKDESLRGVLPKKRFTVAALVDITSSLRRARSMRSGS